MSEDSLQYDVLIVGAGPAGLTAAIRLKQLAESTGMPLTIAIVEKAASLGAHNLSGMVLDCSALNTLLPNWQHHPIPPPSFTPVSDDRFYYMTAKHAWRLPTPAPMRNLGNIIISISQLCRWLGQIAESLGVDIFPGFAAVNCLFDGQRVVGIQTGDKGLDKKGERTARYEPGIGIRAQYTLISEGCRGQIAEQLIRRFQLRSQSAPQTYALGIKEIWRIADNHYQPGRVMHSIGWPLPTDTYGGSFVYHGANNEIALGFVVGLDYRNPYLDPHQECQRFKTHPMLKNLLKGGERLAYGARALNEGGWQSIPQMHYPGGLLLGASAGLMNVPRIKEAHHAMQSALIAAETIIAALKSDSEQALTTFTAQIKQSSIGHELYRVRNIRPAFKNHTLLGLAYSALDTYVLRGHAPWTWMHHSDHTTLKHAAECETPDYPPADGVLTFDKASSVYLSGTHHREDQPCHLHLTQANIAIDINYKSYASPETHYCPAGVYEIQQSETATEPRLHLNPSNCVHCKTCDIKDPTQNIVWTAPEGGDGPNYTDM